VKLGLLVCILKTWRQGLWSWFTKAFLYGKRACRPFALECSTTLSSFLHYQTMQHVMCNMFIYPRIDQVKCLKIAHSFSWIHTIELWWSFTSSECMHTTADLQHLVLIKQWWGGKMISDCFICFFFWRLVWFWKVLVSFSLGFDEQMCQDFSPWLALVDGIAVKLPAFCEDLNLFIHLIYCTMNVKNMQGVACSLCW